MIDDDPPRIDPANVVFKMVGPGRYHELLHPWYSRGCGDRLLHVRRAWKYKWKGELRRVTLCKINHHRTGKGWERSSRCVNCGHRTRHDVTVDGVGCFTCGCRDLKLTTQWKIVYRCADCRYAPPLTVSKENDD